MEVWFTKGIKGFGYYSFGTGGGKGIFPSNGISFFSILPAIPVRNK